MIVLNNLKFSPDFDFSKLRNAVAGYLNIDVSCVKNAALHKRAVDARNKSDVHFSCAVMVELEEGLEKKILNDGKIKNAMPYKPKEYEFKTAEPKALSHEKRPVVVGFGPAGIFAALALSRAGLCPIVFERGADVDQRTRDVESFLKSGVLDTESNIQFGEGGAGTFSDGKLTTGIKDTRCRAVLKEFIKHGGDAALLYEGKPHIGTDVLKNVIKNIREEIISLGGELYFGHRVCSITIEKGRIKELSVESKGKINKIDCENVILSIGHSARDTFYMLKELGVKMEQKPFSLGVRIEHPQDLINKAQLGDFAKFNALTPADYKLSDKTRDGRGVYTFCMCPGGEVVNASSEQNAVTTNGMSNSKRDGRFANSAVLVSVTPEDFPSDDPLAGIELQRRIEKAAYDFSKSYSPIAQRVGDFMKNKPTKQDDFNGDFSLRGSVALGEISECLPQFICDGIRDGISAFARKLRGFDDDTAMLFAPEARSSSPVRLNRDNELQSANVEGLFPCGEGAGYAGGIMSAAVDGIKCAEALMERMARLD